MAAVAAAGGTSGAGGREPRAGRRERLFLALWPDEEVRAALAALAREALGKSGRRVPAENLHLTLIFLGACDPALRARLEEAATALRGEPFVLRLERLGHWPGPRVLWSAPAEVPEALRRLAADLHGAAGGAGLSLERRPFRAHVTLARKVGGRHRERPHRPIEWPVGEFRLVASETRPEGARYRCLRRWAL